MAEKKEIEEIFSKSIRSGKRTYFFDVRSTKAKDYYLTITESKRDFNKEGVPFYTKHKIYLYKEDFLAFKKNLNDICEYIIKEKGEEIISNNKRQKKDSSKNTEIPSTKFTEVNFEDLGKEE